MIWFLSPYFVYGFWQNNWQKPILQIINSFVANCCKSGRIRSPKMNPWPYFTLNIISSYHLHCLFTAGSKLDGHSNKNGKFVVIILFQSWSQTCTLFYFCSKNQSHFTEGQWDDLGNMFLYIVNPHSKRFQTWIYEQYHPWKV